MMALSTARERLRGVIVPTVTPFDKRGEVDFGAFRALLEFLASQGVNGVVPADLVGEMFSLTMSERRKLLEVAVDACAGRMTVVALTSSPSVLEAVELARYARDVGADVIKLTVPYAWSPGVPATIDMLRRIDDAAQMPFLLESSDDATIPIDVIAGLCDRPNFIGLEEFGSSASRVDRIFSDYSQRLIVLTSGDNASLALGLMGAPGLIVAESNFAPRWAADYLQAARQRNLDRALALFSSRRRYRDLFRHRLERGFPVFVPYTKAALEILGMPCGPCRAPLEDLDVAERAALREALKNCFGEHT